MSARRAPWFTVPLAFLHPLALRNPVVVNGPMALTRDPGGGVANRARTNAVMPVGEVGEICARGYAVMLGYSDNPEATAKAVDADGRLHTGDLGTMDARGYVTVTGRVKEMIIRGGENLFPAEIENVLLEHPDVCEVAVVGAGRGLGRNRGGLRAAIRGRPVGPTPPRRPLPRTHLTAEDPAPWIEVTDWPLTGSGKIQKFVLRDRFVAGQFEIA